MTVEAFNDDELLRINRLVNVPAKPGRNGKPPTPAKHGILGFSRTALWRLVADDKFPKPVRPLPGVVAFRSGDVRQWLRSRSPS